MTHKLQNTMFAVVGALAILGFSAVTISSAEESTAQPLSCMSADVVGLAPVAASTVTLGAYTGVAYYTVEDTGYQVVATVAAGEAGVPIRFVSTLADGQNAMLSVPQAAGSPALELEFQRCGDAVVVRSPTSPPPAVAIVQ
jgi:hypothetical protein